MTNVNPNYRPAFVEDITADVAKYNGYSEAIASASQKVQLDHKEKNKWRADALHLFRYTNTVLSLVKTPLT